MRTLYRSMLVLFLVLLASPALAAFNIDATRPTSIPSGFLTPEGIVRTLYTFVLGIAGIIFLIIFLIGSNSYLTGAGNEEQTSAAKKKMVDAIVGLMLVFAAWAFANSIYNRLVGRGTTFTVDQFQGGSSTTTNNSSTTVSPSAPAGTPEPTSTRPTLPGQPTTDVQSKIGDTVILQITHSNTQHKTLTFSVRSGDTALTSGSTQVIPIKTAGTPEMYTFTIPFQTPASLAGNYTVVVNGNNFGVGSAGVVSLNVTD